MLLLVKGMRILSREDKIYYKHNNYQDDDGSVQNAKNDCGVYIIQTFILKVYN